MSKIGQHFYLNGRSVDFNPDGSIDDYSGLMFLWGDSINKKNYKTFFDDAGFQYLSMGEWRHEFQNEEVFFSNGGLYSNEMKIDNQIISEDLNSGDYPSGAAALTRVHLGRGVRINNKNLQQSYVESSNEIGGGIGVFKSGVGGCYINNEVDKFTVNFDGKVIVKSNDLPVNMFTFEPNSPNVVNSVYLNADVHAQTPESTAHFFAQSSFVSNTDNYSGVLSENLYSGKFLYSAGRVGSGVGVAALMNGAGSIPVSGDSNSRLFGVGRDSYVFSEDAFAANGFNCIASKRSFSFGGADGVRNARNEELSIRDQPIDPRRGISILTKASDVGALPDSIGDTPSPFDIDACLVFSGNEAAGDNIFVGGYGNYSRGDSSFTFGKDNITHSSDISAKPSFVFGFGNQVGASHTWAFGSDNKAYYLENDQVLNISGPASEYNDWTSIIFGSDNTSYGTNNFIYGSNNAVTGVGNRVLGSDNLIVVVSDDLVDKSYGENTIKCGKLNKLVRGTYSFGDNNNSNYTFSPDGSDANWSEGSHAAFLVGSGLHAFSSHSTHEGETIFEDGFCSDFEIELSSFGDLRDLLDSTAPDHTNDYLKFYIETGLDGGVDGSGRRVLHFPDNSVVNFKVNISFWTNQKSFLSGNRLKMIYAEYVTDGFIVTGDDGVIVNDSFGGQEDIPNGIRRSGVDRGNGEHCYYSPANSNHTTQLQDYKGEKNTTFYDESIIGEVQSTHQSNNDNTAFFPFLDLYKEDTIKTQISLYPEHGNQMAIYLKKGDIAVLDSPNLLAGEETYFAKAKISGNILNTAPVLPSDPRLCLESLEQYSVVRPHGSTLPPSGPCPDIFWSLSSDNTNDWVEHDMRDIELRLETSAGDCGGANSFVQAGLAIGDIQVPANSTVTIDWQLDVTVEAQDAGYDYALLEINGQFVDTVQSQGNSSDCTPFNEIKSGTAVLAAGANEIRVFYDTVDEFFHTEEFGVRFTITSCFTQDQTPTTGGISEDAYVRTVTINIDPEIYGDKLFEVVMGVESLLDDLITMKQVNGSKEYDIWGYREGDNVGDHYSGRAPDSVGGRRQIETRFGITTNHKRAFVRHGEVYDVFLSNSVGDSPDNIGVDASLKIVNTDGTSVIAIPSEC